VNNKVCSDDFDYGELSIYDDRMVTADTLYGYPPELPQNYGNELVPPDRRRMEAQEVDYYETTFMTSYQRVRVSDSHNGYHVEWVPCIYWPMRFGAWLTGKFFHLIGRVIKDTAVTWWRGTGEIMSWFRAPQEPSRADGYRLLGALAFCGLWAIVNCLLMTIII
jgi:hypothetical protein